MSDLDRSLTTLWGPVVADFTVEQLPEGEAPEHIRAQWIGACLPIRDQLFGYQATDEQTGRIRLTAGRVAVVAEDAIAVLREAKKWNAVSHWLEYADRLLFFRTADGKLQERSLGSG